MTKPESATKNPSSQMQQDEQGQFSVQKIYTKDISLEVPRSPAVFKEKWHPEVDMDIHNLAESIGKNLFDVVLTITVVVKLESQVAYLVEARQAGVFFLRELPEALQDRVLATTCPSILLPFARELICDLVTRAGFPQFLIQPINFEALYEQHLEKRKTQEAKTNGQSLQ